MAGSIVGLVPVKAQSDRVKGKNTRKFGDTNLLELKLDQLSKAKGFDEIILSSEDKKIREIARNMGFEVHIRDSKYSTSYVSMSEVYSKIASEIPGVNIAWINVTNPLAGTEIYENAVIEYRKLSDEYDCLLSAVEVKENIFYNGKPVNFKRTPWPRSQDLTGLCSLTFVINILKRNDMVKWGSCVGMAPYFYLLDKIDSWDIDSIEDFKFCEMIYRMRNI